MTDIAVTGTRCEAKYMPDAYIDYDTRCGKRLGHVSEHVTKLKLPDVMKDGKTRKIFWTDVISTHTRADGSGVYAACTCGWESDPTSMLEEIARAAFDHAKDMEHLLRKHSVDD